MMQQPLDDWVALFGVVAVFMISLSCYRTGLKPRVGNDVKNQSM